MNFDETSINDLIENDLNYEMNEILQQSTETQQQQQQQHDSSHHFIFDEISTSNVLKKDCEFTNNNNNNNNNNNSIKSESSTRYESELSEHQPTTSTTSIEAEFITFENGSLQSPSTPPPTSSSNDLSNLAWLSSVDVQQSIPKESKQQTDNNNIYQQAETSQVTGQMGSNNSNHPMIPQQQQTNEQQQCEPSTSCNNYTTQQQTRFTPIQPNLFGFNTNQQQVEGGGGYFTTDQPSIINYQQHHRHHRSSYRPYPPVNYRTFDNRNHRQPQKIFPKPVYSYSCLIAMSLQKSKTGALPVSDIYSFMMEKFPYFKTAPDGWKNSVRHNLSLNKCFEKVEKPNGSQRKGCLWALNPAKVNKMEEELQKWKRKDPESIRKSMSNPEEFDREMEELRRSDEEAARRRLMGLANRGLPMINPHHHQLHHHHQHQGGVSGNFNNYPHQYSSGYHPHQLHQHQISHPHHHQQHGGGTTFQQQQQNFTFTLQQPQYQQQQQQSYYNSGQHDNQQSQDIYNTTPDMLTNNLQTTTASSSAGGSYLDTLQSGESETNINELNDLESSLSDLTSFQTDQFFSWNDSIHQQQQQQQIQSEQQQEYIQPSTSSYQQTEQQIIVGNTLPSLTLPPVNNNEKDEFQLTNNNPTFSNSNSYLATNSKTVMLH